MHYFDIIKDIIYVSIFDNLRFFSKPNSSKYNKHLKKTWKSLNKTLLPIKHRPRQLKTTTTTHETN
jgi:hypothetical protein